MRRALSLLRQRIAVDEGVHPACGAVLGAQGFDVEYVGRVADAPDLSGFAALVLHADTPLTPELVERLTPGETRVVAREGNSSAGLDLTAVTRAGALMVTTPPGLQATAVAETTIALLTSSARRVPAASASLKGGSWERSAFAGHELRAKTLALVGLDRVGLTVAGWARQLGMRVVAFDPTVPASVAARAKVELVQLPEVWAQADVLSLHTPVTKATRKLVRADTLALCKPDLCVVCCSHSLEVLDLEAVCAGLDSGALAAVGLALTEEELAAAGPLAAHPRLDVVPKLPPADSQVAHETALSVIDALRGPGSAGAINAQHLAAAHDEALRPFVQLCWALGHLLREENPERAVRARLATDGGREVNIGSDEARQVLEAAALAGLVGGAANLVSAPAVSRELGIVSATGAAELPESLHNIVTLELELEGGGVSSVTGTVFGTTPYVTAIDGYSGFTAFSPVGEGWLMGFSFAAEHSSSAVIAALDVLSAAGLNVESMSVGSKRAAQRYSLGVLVLDPHADPDFQMGPVLERLRALPDLHSVRAAAKFSPASTVPVLGIAR